MAYIVVVTEYLTKWADAKAVKTDTVAHAATFIYLNIILVSVRKTHFLNF